MKTKSKQQIAALVAACMAIALTACGSGGASSGNVGSSTQDGNPIAQLPDEVPIVGGGGSTLVEKPAISVQPVSKSVVSGSTATFSVTATGGETLVYQWKKNGTDIPGANSNSFTLPATSDADIGAVLAYSVVVTNSAGTVTSSEAKLTVSPAAPAITSQPVAQTVTADQQTASFSVEASGTLPLIYQWKKGNTNIPGATDKTYTTDLMSIADSGVDYSVVVSNSAGAVSSSNARLTVNKSPIPGFRVVLDGSNEPYAVEECVKEISTGFVWEGKTATSDSPRWGSRTFTNFDSTDSAQFQDGTQPTAEQINSINNSIGYVNYVNEIRLCGFTDWRLPTKDELLGILDVSKAYPLQIDTTWFLNTYSIPYWTSSPFEEPFGAWAVNFDKQGYRSELVNREGATLIRLVRGNQ